MSRALADEVMESIGRAAQLYHRLVILVAPAGAGKTAALQDVHERIAAPLVNVNLELSQRMLDLTERRRLEKAALENAGRFGGWFWQREQGGHAETFERMNEGVDVFCDTGGRIDGNPRQYGVENNAPD